MTNGTAKKTAKPKAERKSLGPIRYLNIGVTAGWAGKMHQDVASAEKYMKAAERFGLPHDWSIFAFDRTQRPIVEPDPETGQMRLVYLLEPVGEVATESPDNAEPVKETTIEPAPTSGPPKV